MDTNKVMATTNHSPLPTQHLPTIINLETLRVRVEGIFATEPHATCSSEVYPKFIHCCIHVPSWGRSQVLRQAEAGQKRPALDESRYLDRRIVSAVTVVLFPRLARRPTMPHKGKVEAKRLW